MGVYKVLLECDGEQREFYRQYDSLEEAETIEGLMVAEANRLCALTGVPIGQIVSITEVKEGTNGTAH